MSPLDAPAPEARRRELLRQASVALHGRPITLWEIAPSGEVMVLGTSQTSPPFDTTALDVDATLARWGVPIRAGSRWVGGRVDEKGRWCVAPVRHQLAEPPPTGVERRSAERITLELAGLCLGLVDQAPPGDAEVSAQLLDEFTHRPGIIAHEVNNQLLAARSSLVLSIEAISKLPDMDAARRTEILTDLANVALGLGRAGEFLRAVRDRARGTLVRTERFDAVQVVRSCTALLKPLVVEKGAGLELAAGAEPVYLRGDPNRLYQVLANLIHNAADASAKSNKPIGVSVSRSDDTLEISVRDRGRGIAPETLGRIFESGFTTKGFGAGSGQG
ncbi:MAG: sensor histidine kinase, partial [Gemmatimonadales bacterium]